LWCSAVGNPEAKQPCYHITDGGYQQKQATVKALSQAFLYAGAQSVIAALWDVDDKATKTVMLSFYSNLREGMSKEEALRTAQLEIRKKYPQPYYWAGFVLTGVSSN